MALLCVRRVALLGRLRLMTQPISPFDELMTWSQSRCNYVKLGTADLASASAQFCLTSWFEDEEHLDNGRSRGVHFLYCPRRWKELWVNE